MLKWLEEWLLVFPRRPKENQLQWFDTMDRWMVAVERNVRTTRVLAFLVGVAVIVLGVVEIIRWIALLPQ